MPRPRKPFTRKQQHGKLKKPHYRKKLIPIVNEAELKKTRSEINKRNRQRAKNHEHNIAKFLRGQRTPSSGAMAAYKGDVKVAWRGASFMVECKMSADLQYHSPSIKIDFTWLPKLQKDVISMQCLFGVLITHYHDTSMLRDYVFIREEDVRRFLDIDINVPEYNVSIKNDKEVRYFRVIQPLMERQFGNNIYIKHITPYGKYIVMHLQDFRDLLDKE